MTINTFDDKSLILRFTDATIPMKRPFTIVINRFRSGLILIEAVRGLTKIPENSCLLLIEKRCKRWTNFLNFFSIT